MYRIVELSKKLQKIMSKANYTLLDLIGIDALFWAEKTL
jgi:hypothetical protein